MITSLFKYRGFFFHVTLWNLNSSIKFCISSLLYLIPPVYTMTAKDFWFICMLSTLSDRHAPRHMSWISDYFIIKLQQRKKAELISLVWHIEGKKDKGKQWATYLTGLCEWVSEYEQRWMVTKVTKERKLLEAMATSIRKRIWT